MPGGEIELLLCTSNASELQYAALVTNLGRVNRVHVDLDVHQVGPLPVFQRYTASLHDEKTCRGGPSRDVSKEGSNSQSVKCRTQHHHCVAVTWTSCCNMVSRHNRKKREYRNGRKRRKDMHDPTQTSSESKQPAHALQRTTQLENQNPV